MKKIIEKNKVAFRENLIIPIVILCLTLSAFVSCNFQKKEDKQIIEDTGKRNNFPYDLNNPDTVYYLPEFLNEISGISCYKKNMIACVQDENAIIYIFDIETGKFISKFDFGKNDDYEDIAIVGNSAYVLRSDGTLFVIKNFEESQKKAIKIKTPLNNKNNTEGLFFDKYTNSLLIACKDSPSFNKNELYNGFKAIYRFDIKNNMLIKKPAYLIALPQIDSVKVNGSIEKFYIETARKLKLINNSNYFCPSGIAIHPIDTGNIYIISSVNKLLIIINKQGMIMDIIELDKRIFNQPEGICFSENGDLFISNEGGNGNANILIFRPIIKL
jgi:uncharacterized protein YjiK